VVLVLIGITVSMVTLSIGSAGDREAEQEARRLAALVGLASEEAVLKSQELGIRFREDGYEFYGMGAEGWAPLKDDVLRTRTLPAGFVVRAWVEGMPVDPDRETEQEEEGGRRPHGYFLSSGERTPPFEVELGPEYGTRYRVAVPMLGDLEVKGPFEAEQRR